MNMTIKELNEHYLKGESDIEFYENIALNGSEEASKRHWYNHEFLSRISYLASHSIWFNRFYKIANKFEKENPHDKVTARELWTRLGVRVDLFRDKLKSKFPHLFDNEGVIIQ